MRYHIANNWPNGVVIRDMMILGGFMIATIVLTSRFFNWKQVK